MYKGTTYLGSGRGLDAPPPHPQPGSTKSKGEGWRVGVGWWGQRRDREKHQVHQLFNIFGAQSFPAPALGTDYGLRQSRGTRSCLLRAQLPQAGHLCHRKCEKGSLACGGRPLPRSLRCCLSPCFCPQLPLSLCRSSRARAQSELAK